MYGRVLLKNNCQPDMEIDLQHPVEGKFYFHQLEVILSLMYMKCVSILAFFNFQNRDIFLWKLTKLESPNDQEPIIDSDNSDRLVYCTKLCCRYLHLMSVSRAAEPQGLRGL